jgi:hypothetical protein
MRFQKVTYVLVLLTRQLDLKKIGDKQQWASEKMAGLPLEEQKKFELAAKVCQSPFVLTLQIVNRHQVQFQDRKRIKEEMLRKINQSAKILEDCDMLYMFVAVDISGNGSPNYTLCSPRAEEVVRKTLNEGLTTRIQSQACRIVHDKPLSLKQNYTRTLNTLIHDSNFTGKILYLRFQFDSLEENEMGGLCSRKKRF